MKNKIFFIGILICLCLCACSTGDTVSGNSEANQSSKKQTPSSSTFSNSLLETANTKYLPLFGNLINCDDWDNAQEIPVYMYCDWYRDHINSITTYEERIERYKINDFSGWAFPAEEFENYVKQYFSVSTEYLRENNEVYLANKQVYLVGGGSNISYRTKVESDEDIQMNEETLIIRVACSFFGDFSDTIYKILVIDTSGGKINFVSCRTV